MCSDTKEFCSKKNTWGQKFLSRQWKTRYLSNNSRDDSILDMFFLFDTPPKFNIAPEK